MFEYKHMEEYNQWIRYQRMNHQKHQLKRKCVCHSQFSRHTIDNNIFRFDCVDSMTFGHRKRNAICHWYTLGSMDSIKVVPKTAQLFVASNFVEMPLLLLLLLILHLYLSLYSKADSTRHHTLTLACVNSIVESCDSHTRRTHTRTQYTIRMATFCLLRSRSRRRSVVYLWNFVGRPMGIYSRSIVTGWRYLFDS